MKNKFYCVFLCLLTCFAFMNSVFALEFSTYTTVVDGKSTVVKGEKTTILVGVKSDEQIASCIFNVSSDSTLSLVDKTGMIANGWVLSSSGESEILVENSLSSEAMSSGKNVLSLTYQVNDSGRVTIKSECSPLNEGQLGTSEDVTVDLTGTDISEDYTLSNVVVTGGTLSPNVSPNVDSYIIQLNTPDFGLEFTASNPDYQDDIVVTNENGDVISNLDNISFNASSGGTQMIINVNVNNKKQYVFLAVYEQVELDNSLEYLKIDGNNIYVSGQKDYTYKVGKDVSSVKIEAKLIDEENFKFDEFFENGYTNLTLSGSNHDYSIVVEPKSNDLGADGAVYTITIEREGATAGGTEPKPSSSTPKPSSTPNKGNTTTNPSTGGVSMFLMAVILIASLFGSVFLYQKNMEGYNK